MVPTLNLISIHLLYQLLSSIHRTCPNQLCLLSLITSIILIIPISCLIFSTGTPSPHPTHFANHIFCTLHLSLVLLCHAQVSLSYSMQLLKQASYSLALTFPDTTLLPNRAANILHFPHPLLTLFVTDNSAPPSSPSISHK